MPWPTEVVILDEDCNISSYYGPSTKGSPREELPYLPSYLPDKYPNSTTEWLYWEFRRAWHEDTPLDDLSPHLLGLQWWTKFVQVSDWMDTAPKTCPILLELITSDYSKYPLIYKRPLSLDQWNYRVRLKYNLTWALFGYTEGQPQPIPQLLSYINGDPSLPINDIRHNPCPIFQKLEAPEPPKFALTYGAPIHAKKKKPPKKVPSRNKYSVS